VQENVENMRAATESKLTHRKRILTLLTCLLVGADGVALASSPGELSQLNGRWKLDWEKSESMDPAMALLEVPWLVKKMSGVVTIHATFEVTPSTCESCAANLRILNENPIKNTTRRVILDGEPVAHTDPLGNDSMDSFIWSEATGLKMVRERVLKSGKKAKIIDVRFVEDDLASMVSVMTVFIDGEERANVRRVLTRVDD
jgi:hypothetical protein